MSLISAVSHFFSAEAKAIDLPSSKEKANLVIPEDSALKRHFLTQLRADIEKALLPNLPDPSLKHYYEATVAAEYQKRLSDAVKY